MWGGPVRSVSTLCEELARQGHDVTVFTTDAGLGPADIPMRTAAVLRNGVKVHYYPRDPGFGIKSSALEEAVRVRAKEFDLIHVTAIWQRTGTAACRAAWAAGVPYVISPRGALGPYSWTRGTLKKLAYYFLHERRNLHTAAGFHYTSAMEKLECRRFRFGQACCIVANGIDFQLWARNEVSGAAWRQAGSMAAGDTVLLYAGRLHHKKGLDLLPSVLDKLQDENWVMAFVGKDEDGTGNRLQAEFSRRGLSSRVRFLPGVDPASLVAAYSGADVLVFPSAHENFGNVAVEAAACGCWVLASAQVGVAHELAALGAGECLPRETAAWATALDRWAGSSFGGNLLRNRLADAFDMKVTAEVMARFYETLLTER